MVPHGSRVLVGLGLVLLAMAVRRTFVAFGASFCQRREGGRGSMAPGQWLRSFSASCPFDNAAADVMKRQREIANQAARSLERQTRMPVLSAVVFCRRRERQRSSPLVVLVLALRFLLFPSLLDHPGRSVQEASSQEINTTKQQESP